MVISVAEVRLHRTTVPLVRPFVTAVRTATEIEAPGVVPVNEWDDHAVHIYVLDLLLKSQWWVTCPEPVKAEVQKHRAAHMAALAQQQGGQMPTPPGPPPEPGQQPPAKTTGANDPAYTGNTEDQIQKGVA